MRKIPGKRSAGLSGDLRQFLHPHLRGKILLNIAQKPAVASGKIRQFGKSVARRQRERADHPPEKHLEITNAEPVRRREGHTLHPFDFHRVGGKLPAMPLLLENIHPGQNVQIEMTAQKFESVAEFKT